MSAEPHSVMMMKRLKGQGVIAKAANHNKRTHGASSADPALLHLNSTIHGPDTAEAVSALAKQLMAAAGTGKPRKDAVLGIEIVFSLPAGTLIPRLEYFSACTAWVATHFGGYDNILSCDIHLDESQPHCHALILPMVNGKLNGSDMFGSNAKRLELQASFHAEVGSLHGLRRPPPRLSGAAKHAGVAGVIDRLTTDADPALRSAVWGATCDAIARFPEPFMQALNIPAQTTPPKTFKQIALSTGKGPKTAAAAASRDRRLMTAAGRRGSTHIGIETGSDDRTLSCVGFAEESPLSQPPDERKADTPSDAPVPCKQPPRRPPVDGQFTRERDLDQDPCNFHNGEHIPRPPPSMPGKAAACAWVDANVGSR